MAHNAERRLTTRQAEKLYSSHEAGVMLQMDPSSIVKWVNDGKLPAYKTPGGHRRIKQSDLLAFLTKHGMYVPPELSLAKKVLLVDDDKVLLQSLKRALKNHAGIQLETAEGGIPALVKVGAWQPQVLVLDVHMPDVDGLEVLKRLKAAAETQNIEVVMVSGKPSAELEKKVRSLGAMAFLPKPFTAAQLASVVAGQAQLAQ